MSATGLLLAAGAGRRFGGGKLLSPLDGQPLALHALVTLHTVVDQVLAVTRPGDDELLALLQQAGASVTVCPDADAGMGASLAWGAARAPRGPLVVALADMPRVRTDSLRRVIVGLDAAHPIAVPRYRGEPGHPVAFADAVRPALLSCGGDRGARHLITDPAWPVRWVEVDDPGVRIDVDTPQALTAVEAGPAPT